MGKYKILQKGYKVNFDKIEEGYLASEVECTAETANKARYYLFDRLYGMDWKIKHSGEDVTYCNIPIKRYYASDIVEFEGKEVRAYKIDEILAERKRYAELDTIMNNEAIKYCYIYKGSYYRPNSCGYTDSKLRAGVYTKQEAISDAKFCHSIKVIPIDIDEHNAMLMKEIEEFKTRLI